MESPDITIKKKIIHRVSRACVPCQKGHLSCDNGRPCMKCKSRSIDCFDGIPKRRGRKRKNDPTSPQITNPIPQSINVSPIDSRIPNNNLQSIGLENFVDTLLGNGELELSEENIQMFSDAFFSSFSDEPNKRTCESERDLRDHLQQYNEMILSKVPELYSGIMKIQEVGRNAFLKIREKMTVEPNVLSRIQTDVNFLISSLSASLEILGAPALIWERNLSICHANKAVRDLTGFSAKLPTPYEEFAVSELLSPMGFRQYMVGSLQIALDTTEKDSWTFPCGLRNYREPNSFIEGTLCVTMKRDPTGFALLIIGIFLPFSLPVPSEVSWEKVASTFENRIKEGGPAAFAHLGGFSRNTNSK